MSVQCVCQECGKSFSIRPAKIKSGRGKFCSRACKGRASTAAPIEIRFWQNVQVCTHGKDCIYCCHEWQGLTDDEGYGRIYRYHELRDARASRVAWELHHCKRIPKKLLCCHYCHNRSCVNYSHLHPGTALENMADSVRDNRLARGENNAARKYPHLLIRGSKHPLTHLTDNDVRIIRLRHLQGHSLSLIAHDYHCTKQSTWAIVQRKTWKHLP